MEIEGSLGPWVHVPLSHGQVVVPADSSMSWGPGLALTSPCRGELLAAHRILDTVASRIPLSRLSSPAEADVLLVVARARSVMAQAGVALDDSRAMAVACPRQADRGHGVALVDRGRAGRMFLKWSDDPVSVEAESAVLEALDGGHGGFRTPRLLATGSDEAGAWMSTTALPPGRHRPCWTPDWLSLDALSTALVDAAEAGRLGGVARADDGRSVAHGDFAPWNVRRCGTEVWVIDWADAGWQPPGFDRLYFEVSAVAMGHRTEISPPSPDALEAVRGVVLGRVDRRAEKLDVAMDRTLATLEPR